MNPALDLAQIESVKSLRPIVVIEAPDSAAMECYWIALPCCVDPRAEYPELFEGNPEQWRPLFKWLGTGVTPDEALGSMLLKINHIDPADVLPETVVFDKEYTLIKAFEDAAALLTIQLNAMEDGDVTGVSDFVQEIAEEWDGSPDGLQPLVEILSFVAANILGDSPEFRGLTPRQKILAIVQKGWNAE